jgi:hypothetical protein
VAPSNHSLERAVPAVPQLCCTTGTAAHGLCAAAQFNRWTPKAAFLVHPNSVDQNPYSTPQAELREQVRIRVRLRRFFILWILSSVLAALMILGLAWATGEVVNIALCIGLTILIVPTSAFISALGSIFKRPNLAVAATGCTILTFLCSFSAAYWIGTTS